MRLTRGKVGTIASAALALAGCSLLVHLDDATGPSCLDGGCADATHPGDGGVPSPEPCGTLEAGAFCAYAGGCQCTYCQNGACSDMKACPEGFNWEAGNDLSRCCSGLAVLTDTNENCGVCGIQCATAGVTSPQNCALLGGHYQCTDCAANADCWSGCCAIDTTPYHCAESNCNTGDCAPGLCPAPSTCTSGAGEPNYCSYD